MLKLALPITSRSNFHFKKIFPALHDLPFLVLLLPHGEAVQYVEYLWWKGEEGNKEELRYFYDEIFHIVCERARAFYFRTIDYRKSSSLTWIQDLLLLPRSVKKWIFTCAAFFIQAVGGVVAIAKAKEEEKFQSKTCFMLKRFSALSPKLQSPSIQICLISLSETLSRILLSHKSSWIHAKSGKRYNRGKVVDIQGEEKKLNLLSDEIQFFVANNFMNSPSSLWKPSKILKRFSDKGIVDVFYPRSWEFILSHSWVNRKIRLYFKPFSVWDC